MIPRRGGTGDDFGREKIKKKPSKPSSPPSTSSSSISVSVKTTKRKTGHDSEEDEEKWGAEYLRKKHHFIRTTIRTDYQPDICKDYKETGFCGFGDSCKFLHDRTDYKHGWQLDQEFAKGEYKDDDEDAYLIIKDNDQEQDNSDKVEEIDGIPIICVICKEKYKEPIVTKCKHYFCIKCAEKNSNINCFTCQKPTSGIFKNASKIVNSKIK